MKVALPSKANMIDSHFGHCDHYTLFTVNQKNQEILDTEILKAGQGCGCKSGIASILAAKEVSMMIAGNMGDGAVKVLNKAGIKVLRGCSGNVKDVTQQWLQGILSDSGESCQEHECGDH